MGTTTTNTNQNLQSVARMPAQQPVQSTIPIQNASHISNPNRQHTLHNPYSFSQRFQHHLQNQKHLSMTNGNQTSSIQQHQSHNNAQSQAPPVINMQQQQQQFSQNAHHNLINIPNKPQNPQVNMQNTLQNPHNVQGQNQQNLQNMHYTPNMPQHSHVIQNSHLQQPQNYHQQNPQNQYIPIPHANSIINQN